MKVVDHLKSVPELPENVNVKKNITDNEYLLSIQGIKLLIKL